jgi:hypothetical protein
MSQSTSSSIMRAEERPSSTTLRMALRCARHDPIYPSGLVVRSIPYRYQYAEDRKVFAELNTGGKALVITSSPFIPSSYSTWKPVRVLWRAIASLRSYRSFNPTTIIFSNCKSYQHISHHEFTQKRRLTPSVPFIARPNSDCVSGFEFGRLRGRLILRSAAKLLSDCQSNSQWSGSCNWEHTWSPKSNKHYVR